MGLDIYLNPDDIGVNKEAQYTGFRTSGKNGYIRSSYNPFGLGQWIEANFGVGLCSLLPPEDQESTGEFIKDWDKQGFLNWANSLKKKAKGMKESFLYIIETPLGIDYTTPEVLFEGKKRIYGGSSFGGKGINVLKVHSVKDIFGRPAIEMTVKVSSPDHKWYLKQINELVAFGKLAVKCDAGIMISG